MICLPLYIARVFYICLPSTTHRIFICGYVCFIVFASSLMVDHVVVTSSMMSNVSCPLQGRLLLRIKAFVRLRNLPSLFKLA